MKTIIFILLLFFNHLICFSQEWQTDYNATVELAKTQNKSLILVFSGSDWCGPCIKLHNEILTKPEFNKVLNSKYVIVNADFPKKKKVKPYKVANLKIKISI